MLLRAIDLTSSLAATLARGVSGVFVGKLGRRPEQPLELYEFEGCPFCRKVREAFTILDLEARIWPCPKGGPRYRPELQERGGKAQFPYLVDPNTGKEMYESDDIIRYLFETYGDGAVPLALSLPLLTDLSAQLASLLRGMGGTFYREARACLHPKDRAAMLPAEIMAHVYEALLEDIRAGGYRVFFRRHRLPAWRKVWLALKAWAAA